MTIALLIVACTAVLADAYITRLGLRAGLGEDNAVREWLIRVLGEDLGTWGVAVCACGALAGSYAISPHSPIAGISYALVFCAYTYVSFNNYQRVKR